MTEQVIVEDDDDDDEEEEEEEEEYLVIETGRNSVTIDSDGDSDSQMNRDLVAHAAASTSSAATSVSASRKRKRQQAAAAKRKSKKGARVSRPRSVHTPEEAQATLMRHRVDIQQQQMHANALFQVDDLRLKKRVRRLRKRVAVRMERVRQLRIAATQMDRVVGAKDIARDSDKSIEELQARIRKELTELQAAERELLETQEQLRLMFIERTARKTKASSTATARAMLAAAGDHLRLLNVARDLQAEMDQGSPDYAWWVYKGRVREDRMLQLYLVYRLYMCLTQLLFNGHASDRVALQTAVMNISRQLGFVTCRRLLASVPYAWQDPKLGPDVDAGDVDPPEHRPVTRCANCHSSGFSYTFIETLVMHEMVLCQACQPRVNCAYCPTCQTCWDQSFFVSGGCDFCLMTSQIVNVESKWDVPFLTFIRRAALASRITNMLTRDSYDGLLAKCVARRKEYVVVERMTQGQSDANAGMKPIVRSSQPMAAMPPVPPHLTAALTRKRCNVIFVELEDQLLVRNRGDRNTPRTATTPAPRTLGERPDLLAEFVGTVDRRPAAVPPADLALDDTTKYMWRCERKHQWEASIEARVSFDLHMKCPLCPRNISAEVAAGAAAAAGASISTARSTCSTLNTWPESLEDAVGFLIEGGVPV